VIVVRDRLNEILVCALAGALAITAASAIAAQGDKTQWDGVYTQAQAKRGEQVYQTACASCHGPDLSGGEMAPGLTGADFVANWTGASVADLFERIRTSMPQDNPGSLTGPQNADVIAYILSKGGFRAGDGELPSQPDTLASIKFVRAKPGP